MSKVLSNAELQNLDIQYTVGVAQGVPVTFFSVGADNKDDWSGFLDLINYILAMEAPPQVITTSYGFDEVGIDSKAANTLCHSYAQLAARGVSMVSLIQILMYKVTDGAFLVIFLR
jgi:tripeptidyl-peptidase-1